MKCRCRLKYCILDNGQHVHIKYDNSTSIRIICMRTAKVSISVYNTYLRDHMRYCVVVEHVSLLDAADDDCMFKFLSG